MKQFMDVVRENRALRKKVEEGLMKAHGSFTVASALMSTEMLEQALLYPKQSVELDMTFQNVMSVNVPVYQFKTRSDDAGEIYPYGFATTSGERGRRGGGPVRRVPGYAQAGGDRKDLPAAGRGDRKDPPAGSTPWST